MIKKSQIHKFLMTHNKAINLLMNKQNKCKATNKLMKTKWNNKKRAILNKAILNKMSLKDKINNKLMKMMSMMKINKMFRDKINNKVKMDNKKLIKLNKILKTKINKRSQSILVSLVLKSNKLFKF